VRDPYPLDERVRSVAPEELLGPLTEIEKRAAPEALFLQGQHDLLKSGSRVAVVGSRRASPEALRWAKEITKMLVDHDITVVSGLALGVDTVAHETAIRAGGRTVAVLGTSLDQYAVPRNRHLQDEIGDRHLLVSQFPIGGGFHRSHFPRRNKPPTIAGFAGYLRRRLNEGEFTAFFGSDVVLVPAPGHAPAPDTTPQSSTGELVKALAQRVARVQYPGRVRGWRGALRGRGILRTFPRRCIVRLP